MKRWWWRLWGRCPNCGEKLIPSAKLGKSLQYEDCVGCGYYRHPESGFEHYPQAVRS